LAAEALREGLTQLAKLLSLADALRRNNPETDSAAFVAATAIDELARAARAVGAPPAPQAGPQLLEHLHVNPMAALP
jgi:hypothetical protein